MLIIGLPKETATNESRVAITPNIVQKLTQLPAAVYIESGTGLDLFSNEDFQSAGAEIVSTRTELLKKADVLLGVQHLPAEDIPSLKPGAICISHLDPFTEIDFINLLTKQKISAISMQMIPRISKAQTMDVLSSQASLAGYVSVILAAERSNKVLPMMITAAGTLFPAKVLVIGAGVAGLQAIATAKRLGARVYAFDTRPEVKEQVESLGGKFVKIDLGKTEKTKDGYAKTLTPEQLALQQEGLAKVCAQSDIVITTALIFGKKAPVVLTKKMIETMQPGSIIVDMAVESGGNVEGSVLGKEIIFNGVRILGLANLPGRVALHASEMYANNLLHFIQAFWNKDTKKLHLTLEDEIIKAALMTHEGKIFNETIKEKLA